MKIDDFKGYRKIADIIKDDADSNNLQVNCVAKEIKKGEKTTYAKVVDGKIKHIFESSDFKSLSRYYRNHNKIKQLKGDKATDSNFAKYPLAKADLEAWKKVEIYELNGTKKECLKQYYKQENKYPDENFQSNKDKIPNEIIQEYENIKLCIKKEHAEIQKNAQSRDKKVIRKEVKR